MPAYPAKTLIYRNVPGARWFHHHNLSRKLRNQDLDDAGTHSVVTTDFASSKDSDQVESGTDDLPIAMKTPRDSIFLEAKARARLDGSVNEGVARKAVADQTFTIGGDGALDEDLVDENGLSTAEDIEIGYETPTVEDQGSDAGSCDQKPIDPEFIPRSAQRMNAWMADWARAGETSRKGADEILEEDATEKLDATTMKEYEMAMAEDQASDAGSSYEDHLHSRIIAWAAQCSNSENPDCGRAYRRMRRALEEEARVILYECCQEDSEDMD
ncbi:MAG: hypothetical protein Q9159_000365 [Coniocarpon cinnabarinum]